MNQFKQKINKVVKEQKIPMPLTRQGIKILCKALNLHCTETTSYEAIIACRGKFMDSSPPEDFNLDKLVSYLHYKAKFMPAADNPRAAVSQAAEKRRKKFDMAHTMKNAQQTRLPPLRGTHPYNTNRS